MASLNNTEKATLLSLLAIFFWSTLPVASLITAGVPPLMSLAVIYSMGSIAHIIYWKIKYGTILGRLKIQPISYIMLYSIGLFSSNCSFLLAMRHGDPVLSYLASNLWPIFSLFFTAIFFGEKVRPLHYVSAVVGFAGVGFIAMKDGGVNITRAELIGFSIGMLNAVIWGLVAIINRKFINVPADSLGAPLAVAALYAAASHLIFEAPTLLSIEQLVTLSYLGIAPWGAANSLWGRAVKYGDIKTITLLNYLVPLLGVMWMVLLGEAQFSTSVFVSMILILFSALLGSADMLFKKNRS